MKVTIEAEFKNIDDAHAFFQRLVGETTPAMNVVVLPEPESRPKAILPDPLASQPDKKPRKARSDAGQPRGPHKATTEAPQSPASATQSGTATDEAVQTRSPSEAPVVPTPAATTPPPAAQPGAGPSFDDARAALGRINNTPGLGMNACMGHLAKFHVNRISLLPKESFAEFIASADALIASTLAEAAAKGKK